MKIILILIFFGLFSCQPSKNKEERHKNYNKSEMIKGSWGSCIDNDTYVELHFDENNYTFHIDNDLLDYNVGKYIFCNDKTLLAIQEKDISCDQEDVMVVKIRFKSRDEFISIEKEARFRYQRLSDTVLMKYKLGTKELEETNYMNEFNYRKDTFKCFPAGQFLDSPNSPRL